MCDADFTTEIFQQLFHHEHNRVVKLVVDVQRKILCKIEIYVPSKKKCVKISNFCLKMFSNILKFLTDTSCILV